MVGLVSALDGVRPALVSRQSPTRQHLGKIRANGIEVDVIRTTLDLCLDLGRFESQEQLVFPQGFTGLDMNGPDDAARGRLDDVFHLHGFHHGNLGPRRYGISDRDGNRNDGALHRRPNP